MADRTHYDVLNVSPSAEPEVIEAAYRALMKKYHPDKVAGEARPKLSAAEINAAFAVLRDPRGRSDYDLRLRAQRPASAGPRVMPPQPFPPAPPPRRTNVAAWSGWGVALAFGCFAAAMPIARGVRTPGRGAAADAAAVAADSADLASEPVRQPPRAAPSVAGFDVSRLPAHLQSIEEVLREPGASRRTPSVQPAVAGRGKSARMTATAHARGRPAAAPRRARVQARGSDGEFLEREGFIY